MLAKKFKISAKNFLQKKPLKITKNKCFLIKLFPNNLSFSRFCILISSKFSKKAVDRNKLRRGLFELIRRCDLVKSLKGLDFLIIVSSFAAERNIENLKEELRKVLLKAI